MRNAKWLVLLMVCAASGARGDDAFTISPRIGWGVPMGDVSADGGDALRDTYTGSLPLQLEAGYRTGRFGGAAYFQWAPAWIADGAFTSLKPDGGRVLRVGVEGSWLFSRLGRFQPWAGLGLGYEWTSVDGHVDAPTGRAELTGTLKGFEAVLQGGAEYRLDARFSVGPFVALTAGRYDSMTVETPYSENTTDFTDKAFHEWLQVGVRGTFEIARN